MRFVLLVADDGVLVFLGSVPGDGDVGSSCPWCVEVGCRFEATLVKATDSTLVVSESGLGDWGSLVASDAGPGDCGSIVSSGSDPGDCGSTVATACSPPVDCTSSDMPCRLPQGEDLMFLSKD